MNEFQRDASQALAELAQRNQLDAYPIPETGNGTAYKNFLNDTVFTVYHDRLDEEHSGRIEIALGLENLSTELKCPIDTITSWFDRTRGGLRPARSKMPVQWPRLAVWTLDEVEKFSCALELLLNLKTDADPENAQVSLAVADERVMREILTRRGQPAFRAALISAYNGRCAISGCADVEVLEAAHILSHSESQNYGTSNGLLLRADLHTLFDLQLISIDPSTAKVVVSSRLGTTYKLLGGCMIYLPSDPACIPNHQSLKQHFALWQARERLAD